MSLPTAAALKKAMLQMRTGKTAAARSAGAKRAAKIRTGSRKKRKPAGISATTWGSKKRKRTKTSTSKPSYVTQAQLNAAFRAVRGKRGWSKRRESSASRAKRAGRTWPKRYPKGHKKAGQFKPKRAR